MNSKFFMIMSQNMQQQRKMQVVINRWQHCKVQLDKGFFADRCFKVW